MSEGDVLIRKQGRAGRITLNRPGALHALNRDMCAQMTEALLSWRDDASVELVIIDHAEGTRGFCAGGDVLTLAESGKGDGKAGADFFATEYRLNTLIKEYPKPYVAIIDGITMGGGVGVSLHGSHRIATERTVFAMPECGIGLIPDVGGGHALPRLQGELGTWLALTGDRLKGEDTLAAGIATHVCASDEINALTEALCHDGISAIETLNTSAEGRFQPLLSIINQVFAHDNVEEIMASLKAGDDWCKAQAATLETKSPLCMKLALRQLRTGRVSSFRDVMSMEYRVVTRLICTPTFQEGVRAVLIDRDNAPDWQPATLEATTAELVDSFFASLGDDELTFLETDA